MKRLLAVLLGLFFWVSGFSQGNKPLRVSGTPYGLYLHLPDTSGVKGYEVLRKEDNGGYQSVGNFQPVFSVSDLQTRMNNFAGIFPNYQMPKRAFIDTIWNQARHDKKLLTQQEFPLLQLSFGIKYIDTSAVHGRTYQYKVVFAGSMLEFESEKIRYETVRPNFSEMTLNDVKNVGKQVRLEWSVPNENPAPFFELYRKQSAGRGNFEKVGAERGMFTTGKGDSIIFLAIDTNATTGISYDYYLASVDYFGNEGNHSDTARLQVGGRQNVPAIYSFRTRSDSFGIRLSWRALAPNPSLNNILVLRSETYDSGYALLTALPVTETNFLDRNVSGGKLYYYQLIVEGAANYSIPTPRVSGKFMGKIRLDAPYDLTARAVKKGIYLQWQYRDTGNIKGFRVYRSIHQTRDFNFIGDLIPVPVDTNVIRFTDTTITDDQTSYYYAVAAVSRTSSLSPSSLVVSASAAGMSSIPAPTRLRSLWINDTTVSITWDDLSMTHPGIGQYKIFSSDQNIKTVSTGNLRDSTEINEFIDEMRPGQERWYWLKAQNFQGLESEFSSAIRVAAPINRPLPPTVHLYKQNKSVVLTWEPALNGNLQRYHVYRASGDGEPKLLETVGHVDEKMGFTDKNLKQGEIYYYYVTSVDKYGIESDHSAEVFVRF